MVAAADATLNFSVAEAELKKNYRFEKHFAAAAAAQRLVDSRQASVADQQRKDRGRISTWIMRAAGDRGLHCEREGTSEAMRTHAEQMKIPERSERRN